MKHPKLALNDTKRPRLKVSTLALLQRLNNLQQFFQCVHCPVETFSVFHGLTSFPLSLGGFPT